VGSAEICELLLSQGASPDVGDENNGKSPLHIAASKSFVDVALVLLKAGANPNVTCKSGMTPLHNAVLANNVSLCELLVTFGAEINSGKAYSVNRKDEVFKLGDAVECRFKGGSVWMEATVVRTTLQCGHPLYDVKYGGGTVDTCVHPNHIRRQLKSGDVMTPLFYAVCAGFYTMALWLLNHGAIVNAVNNDGDTPLLICVKNKFKYLSLLLLDRGADATVLDALGKSAMYYAVKNNLVSVCTELINRGAYVPSADTGILHLHVGSKVWTSVYNEYSAPVWFAGYILAIHEDENTYDVLYPPAMFKKERLQKRIACEEFISLNSVPLIFTAIENSFLVLCKLLLDNGVALEAKNEVGRWLALI
jgi:ankyrin repeat protein